MMNKVKVIILRTAGTNCDEETQFAFEQCGAEVEKVHINEILTGKKYLTDYHILTLPGGFTYGDDIAAGKILANELKYKLSSEMEEFIREGKPVLGICNGFQILAKAGYLPAHLFPSTHSGCRIYNHSDLQESRPPFSNFNKKSCFKLIYYIPFDGVLSMKNLV